MAGIFDEVMDGLKAKEPGKETPAETKPAETKPAETKPEPVNSLHTYSDDFAKKYGEKKKTLDKI